MCLPEGVSEAPVPEAGESVPPGGAGTDRPCGRPGPGRGAGASGGARGPALLRRPSTCPRTPGTGSRTPCSGPPIASERQSVERLGKPTALAVLSSDVISSSAYATEQILVQLVKYIGVAAFALVVPVTIAVVVVLLFVTASYLEVVKVYTKSGRRLRGGP